jgi:hypothetical protein
MHSSVERNRDFQLGAVDTGPHEFGTVLKFVRFRLVFKHGRIKPDEFQHS